MESDLVVALVNGFVLVGRPSADGKVLRDALELLCTEATGASGKRGFLYSTRPFLLLAGWRDFGLPPGANVKPLSELDPSEATRIAVAYEGGLETRQKITLASSGVKLATRLPGSGH